MVHQDLDQADDDTVYAIAKDMGDKMKDMRRKTARSMVDVDVLSRGPGNSAQEQQAYQDNLDALEE